MKQKTLTLDLTKLRNLSGKLVPDKDYELLLIENYKMITDKNNNTFLKVRELITADVYKDSKRTSYKDFTTIMNEDRYYSTMHKFHSLLEHILFKQLPHDVIDVVFDSVIENTKTSYMIKFKLKYQEDYKE